MSPSSLVALVRLYGIPGIGLGRIMLCSNFATTKMMNAQRTIPRGDNIVQSSVRGWVGLLLLDVSWVLNYKFEETSA